MIRRRNTSRRNALVILALVATMLGSALVGLHSGGGFRNTLAEATPTSFSSPPESAKTTSTDVTDAPTTAHRDRSASDLQPASNTLASLIRRGDLDAMSKLLPKGITDIDGMGGRGLQRQVKSQGIWFPVFNLSKAKPLGQTDADGQEEYDPDSVSLNEIPLTITSAAPPATLVGVPVNHVFTAVGGQPPYLWSMQPTSVNGFTLDAASGLFAGQSDEPLTLPYTLSVTDSLGATASTVGTLVITPADPLAIATDTLPVGTVGQAYEAALAATGGMPPYTWTCDSMDFACDPATGLLTGTPADAGGFTFNVTVTDSQQSTVSRQVTVPVAGELEIITDSILRPAAPGASYRLKMEAKGGVPPYQWSTPDAVPAGWRLSTDGVLTGAASRQDQFHRFTLRVSDSAGRTSRRTFDLAIRRSLITVPSRNKVGLAWKPQELVRSLGPLQGVIIRRDGVEIYRGAGNNTVDRGLPEGSTLGYTLTAVLNDGTQVPYASSQTTLLPFTLERGRAGAVADPYPDRVVQFSPLSAGGYGAAQVPANVLGPPDGRSTWSPASQPAQIASLHAQPSSVGGSITLEFTDNIIEAGNGLDFTIFENVFFVGRDPNNRFMEPAFIEVALFEDEWHRFPLRVNPPAAGDVDLRQPGYYSEGFAGVNATTGDDPTDPTRSGGDSFDLARLGRPDLQWIRFIRIRSTGDNAILDAQGFPVRHTGENNALSGGSSSGFDLDAVSAVNY